MRGFAGDHHPADPGTPLNGPTTSLVVVAGEPFPFAPTVVGVLVQEFLPHVLGGEIVDRGMAGAKINGSTGSNIATSGQSHV